jgi:zinc D-Ala-D-Ala carboxypeptidase
MSQYFKPEETRCKCGECKSSPTGANVKPSLLAVMDTIRKDWGKPLSVASGARCPAHNRVIGGAPRSAHMEGIAVDFAMPKGPTREAFLAYILPRLVLYGLRMEDPDSTPSWIHLDLRPVGENQPRIFKP